MSLQNVLQMDRSWSLPQKRVLRRVLRADPGQEYYVYVPSSGGHEAPLFVCVHGLSRNAREQAKQFSGYCEARGAVLLAPVFAPDRYGDYQRLGRDDRGNRADLALEAILEEVTSLTGASSAQVHLFGYSGGAQFAHRYTLAHPHRVARAVVAAAGWYTFPDTRKRFPYGIRSSPRLPNLRFDPEEFLRVPITVVVGEQDGTAANLRRSEKIDRQQGVTRVARARRWVEAMRAAAEACSFDSLVSLETVEGSNHSFKRFLKSGALGERVFTALFEGRSPHDE